MTCSRSLSRSVAEPEFETGPHSSARCAGTGDEQASSEMQCYL